MDNLENQSGDLPYFTIDVYDKVRVLKTGYPVILKNDSDDISLVGVGRVGDIKGRTDKKFIQAYEKQQLKKLYKHSGDIDLLISHDKVMPAAKNLAHFCNKSLFGFVALGAR